MKLDELLLEQSSKPVLDDSKPRSPSPVKQLAQRHQRPLDVSKPVKPRVALASRQEVLEAMQLLAGGKYKVGSINGGKAKRKKERS